MAGHFEWTSLAGNVENAIMCKQLCQWQKSAGADLQDGTLLDFHDAVIFFARQNCSQVSDSIFGLTGIASGYIRPDYNMPAVELYIASLYNTLLSLWRRRPPESAKPAEERSDFEMLEALGLPVSKLKSVGEALLHSFKIEPFQDVTFLISYEVCKRFIPGTQLLVQQYLAYSWLLRTSYTKLKFHREAEPGRLRPEGKVDRLMTTRWYETEDQAFQRFHRDLCGRSAKMLARVEARKKRNKDMTGPAPSLQKMSCSAWVALVHSICDDIWVRASADTAAQAG